MPIAEQRAIQFDAAGVLRAIAGLSGTASQVGLPAVPATGVSFDAEGQCVVLEYGGSSPQPSVRLKSESLCAVLLASCIRQRLPIPRHAAKTVEVQRGSAVLRLRTEIVQCEGLAPAVPALRSLRRRLGQSWLSAD
jgi:hypothetical protein